MCKEGFLKKDGECIAPEILPQPSCTQDSTRVMFNNKEYVKAQTNGLFRVKGMHVGYNRVENQEVLYQVYDEFAKPKEIIRVPYQTVKEGKDFLILACKGTQLPESIYFRRPQPATGPVYCYYSSDQGGIPTIKVKTNEKKTFIPVCKNAQGTIVPCPNLVWSTDTNGKLVAAADGKSATLENPAKTGRLASCYAPAREKEWCCSMTVIVAAP